MKYSRFCINCKQQSPEKRVLAWIRKRISPVSWGVSDPDKNDLHFHVSRQQILKSYRVRRLGGRGHFLAPMPTELMTKHFCGSKIVYFQADGRKRCPEALAEIDIDCHERGSYEGAAACARWLTSNGFPGLFWSRSTNGKGVHAYLRVRKVQECDRSLDDGMKMLERWLKLQLEVNRWDVQDIEIKGRPLVMHWGDEKFDLVGVNMGSLAKLPVEALDRPEELMATTCLTVGQLRRLGAEESRSRRTMLLDGAFGPEASSVPVQGLTSEPSFGEVNLEEIDRRGWLPSMRDGEWPKWVMYVAKNGLQVEDNLGEVLHELAKWLVWVELYHEDDRQKQAVEFLDWFVCHRHNGRITRVNVGEFAGLRSQVRRAVKLAMDISEGKEIMARLRQKRETGKYNVVFMIAPLLSGTGENFTQDGSPPSTYCVPIRNDPLHPQIEAQIIQIAQSNKHRRGEDGLYPIVRFSRRFLNGLWDSGGQARIGQETLNEMSGRNKANQQTAYKALLRDAGLIEDYEGTYRYRSARSLYRLSGKVKGHFAERCQSQTRSA